MGEKLKQLLLDKYKGDFRVDMAVSILDVMLRDKKITEDYYWFSLGLLYAKGYNGILKFKKDAEAKLILQNNTIKEETK